MKPKILLVETPCEEALKIITDVADAVFNGEYDYVWTGLTPVKSSKPVFVPCTGISHVDANTIIHLDAEWKATEGWKVTATAEHTLSLILQLAKKARMQLKDKVVGIIGLGRVGNLIDDYREALLAGRIIYDKYFGSTKPIYDKTFIELLHNADIITLHVPLNDETYHMIGKEEIAMMKQGALLINTSRQGVVDIDDVKDALIQGKIYYADDFRNVVDLEYLGAIQTPHIGGDTVDSRKATDIYIAEKLKSFIKGANKNE